MKPLGRPSSYTDAKAAHICEQTALGRSLKSICAENGMPDVSTVHRWLDVNANFRERYARARERQGAYLAAEIVEIADAASNEDYQTARLRVDARKWYASKLAPKVYGDRQTTEVSGPNGGPVEVRSDLETAQRLAFLLQAGARKDGE